MNAHGTSFIARYPAVTMLLLAIFLTIRGAIPPGMMPHADAEGFAMGICPSSPLARVEGAKPPVHPGMSMPAGHDMTAMDHGGAGSAPSGHDDEDGHAASGWDCPFGALASGAVTPMAAVFTPAASVPELIRPLPLHGLSFGTVAPLPPSTGPPTLS